MLGRFSCPKVSLRSQSKDSSKADTAYRPVVREQVWDAGETAVIVCDMWDSHHCYRAVLRENQMVPRMESLLSSLRQRGATVIHAPSSCVERLRGSPGTKTSCLRCRRSPRRRTSILGVTRSQPKSRRSTRSTNPMVVKTTLPEEHAAWAAKLEAQGLNPKAPWKKQHAGLTIDGDKDFISDQGDEVWNILQAGDIKNVILVGVHTNMCVLGRPFGLRQLAKNGVNVVLMRDLTDSMYNPKSWPHVSHAEGTSLIISHIERYVCPTITSDQILGGKPFEFAAIRLSHFRCRAAHANATNCGG